MKNAESDDSEQDPEEEEEEEEEVDSELSANQSFVSKSEQSRIPNQKRKEVKKKSESNRPFVKGESSGKGQKYGKVVHLGADAYNLGFGSLEDSEQIQVHILKVRKYSWLIAENFGYRYLLKAQVGQKLCRGSSVEVRNQGGDSQNKTREAACARNQLYRVFQVKYGKRFRQVLHYG